MIISITLALVCLIISFIFSGTEAGLLSMNRIQLRNRVKQGEVSARRIQRLLTQPTHLFITVLFVTNLMNVAAIVLIDNLWSPEWGWGSHLLTFILVLPIYILLIEFLAKSIFRKFPYHAITPITILIEWSLIIFRPIIGLGAWIAINVFKLKHPRIFAAREDLKYFIGQRVGSLESIESQMIHNVMDFRAVLVQKIMTPIEKVKYVFPNTPTSDIAQLANETHFDRFPVKDQKDQTGKILGMVNAMDAILCNQPDATASKYLRRIFTIKADETAANALRRLRASPQGLAVVVDSHGKTLGIVSIEDILNPLILPKTVPNTEHK